MSEKFEYYKEIKEDSTYIYDKEGDLMGKEKNGSFTPLKYPAEIIDNITKIRDREKLGKLKTKTKATISGSIFGMLSGIVICLYLRKPVVVGMIIGSIGGGLVANLINKE